MTKKELEQVSLENLREIVSGHSYKIFTWGKKNDGMMVDLTTANVMLTVYDAMKKESQELFEKRIKQSREWFMKAVGICWRCVK